MTDCSEWIAILSGFGPIIIGLITILYIRKEFNLQKQKNNAEHLIQLHREFYNDIKIMTMFELLDSENSKEVNEKLKEIINSDTNDIVKFKIAGKEYGLIETDLNIFMNYLNTIAILVEEGSIEKELVYKLFKYQIERIFIHQAIIEYMEKYNFDRIKKLLPQKFFFYGTLMNRQERLKIEGVNKVDHFLESSDEPYVLEGKSLEFVKIDEVNYPILNINNSLCENPSKIQGRLVKIEKEANWSTLFSALDEYEGHLYKRSIIELSIKPCWGLSLSRNRSSKDFAFVYTKA